MNGLITVIYFLFGIVFSLITFVLWVRIGLQFFQVSLSNSVSKAIYSLTDPVVHPIKMLLFPKQSPKSRYDLATLLVLLIVEIIQCVLIALFFLKSAAGLATIALLVITDFILTPCNIMFYLVLIRAILTWVSTGWHHPANEILIAFTEPLLKLGRKIIPDISGFDFSPIIILIGLEVIYLFVGANVPI